MMIGSTRPSDAARRRCACASALVYMLASSSSWASDGQPSLSGRWRRSDDKPGQAADGSFSRLEFLPRGKVVGLRFLSGVFSGGGEVLESGYGRYRIRGSILSVTPPKRSDSDGWPGRGEVYGSSYQCGLKMDGASASFVLSDCPLSGTWIREAKLRDTPGQ